MVCIISKGQRSFPGSDKVTWTSFPSGLVPAQCSSLWFLSARLYPFTKLILLGFLVCSTDHTAMVFYICRCDCLCASGKMCKDGRNGVVTWLAPGSTVTLCGRGQGMDHFLTTTCRKQRVENRSRIISGSKIFILTTTVKYSMKKKARLLV